MSRFPVVESSLRFSDVIIIAVPAIRNALLKNDHSSAIADHVKIKKTCIVVNANTSSPFCCPTDCAYNRTKGGSIRSPLYPNNYPDGVKCVWVLEAPVNHTVKLKLKEFWLEKDKKCFYDYMEFFDGDTEEHHSIKGRMCGRHDPQTIESTGQKLMVVFRSDKSENYTGFLAVWETKKLSKKIEYRK